VAASSRVSNPGCYPTGFLALVGPLVRAGLIPAAFPLRRQCRVRLFRRRQGHDR
jgi:N-acetyl-gamma-glutamylphosphate reductase